MHRIALGVFFILLFVANAAGLSVDYLIVDKDLFVDSDDYIFAERIDVNNSVNLKNLGYLYAHNITVCDGCTLRLRNSGVWNASFTMGTNANVVQVIGHADEITNLGAFSEYGLILLGDDVLSISDVVDVMATPRYVVLDDARLDIGGGTNWFNNMPIKLVGNVHLYLNNVDALSSGALIQNVSGNGNVSLYIDNMNPLYVAQAYVDNNSLYGRIVRETDYFKILKNPQGIFLNGLRKTNPTDSLLVAMDDATDMLELNDIMAKSMRLNPINMLRPVRLIDAVRAMNLFDVLGGDAGGVTDIVLSSNLESELVSVRGNFHILKNLVLFARMMGGESKYNDGINDFFAVHYGADVGGVYDNNRVRLRAGLMSMVSDFDIGPVFNGRDVVINPRGLTVSAVVDAGMYLDVLKNIRIQPLVGIMGRAEYVANMRRIDIQPFVGSDLLLDAGGAEFEYKYALRGRIDPEGLVSSAVVVSVASPDDGVSGDVSVGFVRNNFARGFSVSANINIDF